MQYNLLQTFHPPTSASVSACLAFLENSANTEKSHIHCISTLIWDLIAMIGAKGAGSFHDIRKSMKKLCANDTSRYPKVLKIGPNHGCQ